MTNHNIITEKKCISCAKNLPLSEFYLQKLNKDGRMNNCKKCHNAKTIERRRGDVIHKEYMRIYNERYRKEKKEEISLYHKAYKQKNKEKLNAYRRNKLKSDVSLRVKYNLRKSLKDLMKTTKNGGSSSKSKLIGCTTQQLSKHLESLFTKGMTWGNYGANGWHVDHILPCASFDHNDPKQVAQCWHYTNLRPLWAKDNITKSDKITNPQMSLLLDAT